LVREIKIERVGCICIGVEKRGIFTTIIVTMHHEVRGGPFRMGARGGAVVETPATNRKVAVSIPIGVIRIFH
jgi:hypothetical protein